MSKKYYVIWKGAKTGVFTSWPDVKANIDGRSDAQYMGFTSEQEAQQAFASTYTKALMKRSLTKKSTNKVGAPANANSNKTLSSTSSPSIQAEIQIYCDGACSPNPGKSGTGIAIYQSKVLVELWYGIFEANGTNNTAELNGLIEAFKFAQPFLDKGVHVQVLSDSKYSIDCLTKWAKGWKNKGWTRGKGEEVKNLELVKKGFDLYEKNKSNLTISHVKGHANIEGNELADRMAVLARTSKEEQMVKYKDKLDIKLILAMASG